MYAVVLDLNPYAAYPLTGKTHITQILSKTTWPSVDYKMQLQLFYKTSLSILLTLLMGIVNSGVSKESVPSCCW